MMQEILTKKQIKRMVTMGILSALSIVLVFFIHPSVFPPPMNFLQYDPADIPILICTFIYGPIPGLIMTIVVSVIQGITVSVQSGWIGIIMHILSTGTFVLVAGYIYKLRQNMTFAAIGLATGVISSAIIMIGCNLIFVPLFMTISLPNGAQMKVTIEQVVENLIPYFIPFNLLKSGINAAIAFILYKPIIYSFMP